MSGDSSYVVATSNWGVHVSTLGNVNGVCRATSPTALTCAAPVAVALTSSTSTNWVANQLMATIHTDGVRFWSDNSFTTQVSAR